MHVDEVVIRAVDGERLAGTLVRPDGDGPFAALLEALPYRKDDVTASYRSTYERYAEAGFAVLRLDLRGTGSSSGVMTDEYPDVERDDLRAAIEWLSDQPWSSGRVGMFGTSYSGFNSLQMAAEGVPALGAVVATYATDDRYTDDVHYAGGILRALDLIDYPLYMIAMNALPPVPSVWSSSHGTSSQPDDLGTDGTWHREWMRRLDQEPWVLGWIDDRADGPNWRRGSIRLGPDGAGYERMSCPTMLIVGWADGYRNNSFRVVEQYERNGLPWRMIAGPWVHSSPERARPGPNIDDDVEIVAFFDEHLRGGPPHDGPRAQVYVRRPVHPEPDLRHQPGDWRDLDRWPPPGLEIRRLGGARDGVDRLRVRPDVGVAAWNSCGGSLPWGQPLDQREDDQHSITHDWPIGSPVEIVGSAQVALRVRTDRPFGQVSLKLCDVFPDGTSALVARGWIDLAHVGCWPADPTGEVGRAPTPPTPGTWIHLDLTLEATTWVVPAGHTLRLSVAGGDFPNCWPAPGPFTLEVDAETLELSVPVVELPASGHRFVDGTGLGDADAAAEAEAVEWRVERDVLRRETRVHTRYGGTYDGEHGAVVTDDYRGEVGVSTVDPARAWVVGSSSFEVVWPEVTVRSVVEMTVRSDADAFTSDVALVVQRDGVEVGRRTWHRRTPR